MADLMRGLSEDAPRHPVTEGAGWWHRPIRLVHPVVHRPAPLQAQWEDSKLSTSSPPLLILGATGTLGTAFARACERRNLAHILTARTEVDLRDTNSIELALDRHQPWAVVNASGWVRVDDAELEPVACHLVNAAGAIELSQAAAKRGIATLNFSSDLVFDGLAARPYVETDCPSPLGVYGKSKARMEAGIAGLEGRHLIIRTAAFFSPFDSHNFAVAVATALSRGEQVRAAADLVVSPTYVPHLVDTALDLLIDGEMGLWHLTSGRALSWAEFATEIADVFDLQQGLIRPASGAELGFRAQRPPCAALDSLRGANLPSIGAALADFRRHFTPTINQRALSSTAR
jgi:dTDP-4-dehydrorhamnose reductase